jgi:phage gpG-like protein
MAGTQVAGLTKLVRDLEGMGVEVADLKAAFGAIANRAADVAAAHAPSVTGRLRRSIKGSKAKNYAMVRAGSARVPYAGAINYGWRARNIAPSNFMERADQAMRGTAMNELNDAINRLIRGRKL